MKVLMVSPSIDVSENLAQTVHQLQFVKNLVRKGVTVHLVCRKKNGVIPLVENAGEDMVLHKVLSTDFPTKRAFFTVHTRSLLKSLIGKEKFDLVHDRGYLFGGAGTFLAKKYSIPCILQIDDDWINTEQMTSRIARTNFYQVRARKWCTKVLKEVDMAFTVTETLKKTVVEEWNGEEKKIFVIPNGVDTEIFNRKAKPYGIRNELKKDAPVVTFVGALGPWHGIQNLINAIPLILKERPDTTFFIVGRAKEYSISQLKKMVEELNVGKAVHFLGSVKHEEVPGILVESDVGVAPYSDFDFGFSPLKIFEYMACGLPVVCSDLPSTREIIDNGKDGVLVKAWQEEDLAKAILKLIGDGPERNRIGEEGRKKAFDNFTWEKSTEKLKKLYDMLV